MHIGTYYNKSKDMKSFLLHRVKVNGLLLSESCTLIEKALQSLRTETPASTALSFCSVSALHSSNKSFQFFFQCIRVAISSFQLNGATLATESQIKPVCLLKQRLKDCAILAMHGRYPRTSPFFLSQCRRHV